MFFFIWFGSAKKAFITMCIFGGVTALFLLSSLISVFFNPALAKVLLIASAVFAFFALLYTLNWLSCRHRDRKRAAAEMRAAQSYQQTIERQAIQAQPASWPVKLPGRGFAGAGLTLGIIGMALISLIGLALVSSSFRHHDADDFIVELILYIVLAVMPLLSIVFGTSAKRRGYPKNSASAAVVLGIIGTAIILIMIVISAVWAFSGV